MTLKILPPSEGLGAVAYREQGQGDPLVLIHGVGMQSAAWWPHGAARWRISSHGCIGS